MFILLTASVCMNMYFNTFMCRETASRRQLARVLIGCLLNKPSITGQIRMARHPPFSQSASTGGQSGRGRWCKHSLLVTSLVAKLASSSLPHSVHPDFGPPSPRTDGRGRPQVFGSLALCQAKKVRTTKSAAVGAVGPAL